jgi:thiamine monophosphate kinase
VLEASLLPVEPAARRWFDAEGRDPVDAALLSGDDYELLFTASPKFRRRVAAVGRADGPLTRIGAVTSDSRLLVSHRGSSRAVPEGYQHFR